MITSILETNLKTIKDINYNMDIKLWSSKFKTPFGNGKIIFTERGVKKVILPQHSKNIQEEQFDFQTRNLSRNNKVVNFLENYLLGKKIDFKEVALDLDNLSFFQKKVLKVVKEIPYGETRCYYWVAKKIKSPSASKAVGQVLSRNPCPIIIPCHRVIGKDGSLKGFQTGLEWKKILLNLEKGGNGWESRE